tara:strand:- start:18094 stop:18324 length:231 start_codon:yes stop_codon:yes gene_type:complete
LKNPSHQKYYLLYKGSSILILALINALKRENIIPVIKDLGESARLAGFGVISPLIQEVYIHHDELKKGKKVLEQLF